MPLTNKPSESMIDASDHALSARPAQNSRGSAKVNTRRRTAHRAASSPKSLEIQRIFSDPKKMAFDQIEWERRTAEITDDSGKVIFKQENVEVPKSWSVLATKVVVSKYFYGEQNTPERETSVRQLVHRVTRTIADWAVRDGYFTREQ